LRQANDRIVFAGFQDHAALRILYENASLFVLPSYHEGLPIAALEAAIIGIPLILSDIAPHRDIDLSPACYFPTGNVEALRQKLMEDPRAFRPDSEAIGRRFDWDLIAQATAKIYRSVLGDAGRDACLDPLKPYVGT
jgi:glycosyltransferase involved in cell wall biosynthesis